MSLSKKTFIFILGAVGLAIVALYISSQTILIKGFRRIEEDRANQNVERVLNAIDEKVASLNVFTADWAAWDDTYAFILDDNEKYISSNLLDESFISAKLNLAVFVDNSGKIVFEKAYDLENEGEIPVPEDLKAYLKPGENLVKHIGIRSDISGIMILGGAPIIISSRPIITSSQKGPGRGTLIMGRFLNEPQIKNLKETTNLNFELIPIDMAKGIPLDKEVYLKTESPQTLLGYAPMKDVFGKTVLVAEVILPRDILRQGQSTVGYFLWAMGAIGIIGVIFSLTFLDKIVLSPLKSVASDVNKITEFKSFSTRVKPVGGTNELFQLGEDINSMLGVLEALRAESETKTKALAGQMLLLEEKNKELEAAKKALDKILEDERRLEEELRFEKANVEKKVEQRTQELVEAKDKISEGWLQMQREKAKLVSSIESLSLGFVITDKTGQILLTNPAVNKILAETTEKWTMEGLQAILGSGFDLNQEVDLCLKDPAKCIPKTLEIKSKFVKITICPITTLENELRETLGVAIIFEDTTAAKLLERARDEFFSIASHELRTPLTAIRGNTAMIKEYFPQILKENPEVSEMIEDTHEASIRLIKIVTDFLDTSRLEQHKVEFKKEIFDLGEVVRHTTEQLKPIASQKGLDLALEIAQDLPQGVGDKDKTSQVVYNLVGNAVNYTHAGSVRVSVALKDGLLQVKVADTGVGISPQNQTLLFKKFQQAGEKILTRDVTRGTGLGLYISNLLAQGMGGKVYLESSEVGKGSTFVFILPAAGPANS